MLVYPFLVTGRSVTCECRFFREHSRIPFVVAVEIETPDWNSKRSENNFGMESGYYSDLREKRVILQSAEAPAIWSLRIGSANSQLHNILGLKSLWTFCHIKLNRVAFIKRLEATTLNGAVMDKNVIAGIAANETISLFIVKPLHGSLFSHLFSLTKFPLLRDDCS
jgi:hypothetical protein